MGVARFSIVAGAVVWAATLAQAAQVATRTTKDGVYTKAQAEAGKVTFDKLCAACHGFKPWAKSEMNPDLAGDVFLANWTGKTVKDLQTLILTTMPNDGSAMLEEPESVELVAYILAQNGFQVGSTPLGPGATAAAITIVK